MWAAGQSRLRPSALIICFLIKHSIATDCRPQCPHELIQVRHRMVEEPPNPFRIVQATAGSTLHLRLSGKCSGSSRPSCALSRLSRDSSVARTSRADHVIPLIPLQDGWSTLHAVLARRDCKHDTCFAAELKICAIPRFYDELGLTQGKQMIVMIDRSDLNHGDCPLNVLESDAIDRQASRYAPQTTPSSGCFSFQSWFFRAICP